jgi:tetratricopeptide (TPR) repeat protein
MNPFWIICLLLLHVFPVGLYADTGNKNSAPQGLNGRIWEQESILLEGDRLFENGFYDQAIAKYHESVAPRFIKSENDKESFYYHMERAHRWRGQLDDALEDLQWAIDHNHMPNIKEELGKPQKPEPLTVITAKETLYEEIQGIKALMEYKKTGSKAPVHRHIEFLKSRYKNMLPPVDYDGNYAPIVASKIIFCYGWIGDADGGIDFMDEIVNYFTSGKVGKRAVERAFTMRNPYFVIRQAFEQDKIEGFKGCLDAKPGEVCMGRATKALIQSKYFPW